MKPKKVKQTKTWTSGGHYIALIEYRSRNDWKAGLYRPCHKQPLSNFLI